MLDIMRKSNMFYSPLRYPGGKGKLAPLMKFIIEKTPSLRWALTMVFIA